MILSVGADFILNEANYYIPDEIRGGTAVDLGCNIGDFELNNGTRFDKYICYDVLEENIQFLVKNLENKNLNYEVHKKAIHDTSNVLVPVYAHQNEQKETEVFGNSGNVGTILYDTGNWGWHAYNKIDEVASVTIEEIVSTYGAITILKIDVEGAEYKGLLNKDLTAIKYIAGEFHFELELVNKLVEFIKTTHNLILQDGNKYYFMRKC